MRDLRKRKVIGEARIKWWKLQGENQQALLDKVGSSDIWSDYKEQDIDATWDKVEHVVKDVARVVLGESKGNRPSSKDISWWNDEVRQAIKAKRECYKALGKCMSNENFEKYKEARQAAKKAVRDAMTKVNQKMYTKLDTKEGEKDIYKLARIRDRKTRDIGRVRCVKDMDNKVLVQDNEIKGRWSSYFDTLFNGHPEQGFGDVQVMPNMVNPRFVRRI
ncbi:hypothetical protein RND81_05G111900 [Saponaria officinalis]|uniref:Uncharacterized protein n=1 Tax=Saponaria officinalis TaxID=3572 RepID=A0AAW1KS87_SAPOF